MSGRKAEATNQPSELVLRIFSALVMVSIALVVTFVGGFWFELLIGIGSVLVVREFAAMARPSLDGIFGIAIIWAIVGVVGAWFAAGPQVSVALAGLAIFGFAVWQNLIHRKIWAAVGVAYAFIPFASLLMLRGDSVQGLHAVLYVFAVVWSADTFAYFSGRLIGGPKLAPGISPKKTWAGFVGGLVGSVVAGLLLLWVLGYQTGVAAASLTILLSLASQAGDLFESWIKRHFGKKDSGVLIPGHGGLLDRVDGLIFAGLAAYLVGISQGGSMSDPGSAGAAFIGALVLP